MEDGEKMTQLEQEIQSYSGFKPSASLVTTFETRRLPRAYLVLLESLLNINSSGRPTCARVSSAIREGRLDPIAPDHNRNAGTLIPTPRRTSQDTPSSISNAMDQTRVTEDGAPHTNEKEAISPSLAQRTPLLRLLEPPRVSVDRTGNVGVWTPSRSGELGVMRVWIPRTVSVKTLKSCILMAKIMTIGSICPEAYPRPIVVFSVFLVAVTDTWFEGLWISAALALLHIAFLRIGCSSGICCS